MQISSISNISGIGEITKGYIFALLRDMIKRIQLILFLISESMMIPY
jgi:hypothetical protein